jgi:outer membrane protein assembly factor BamB
VPLAKLAADWNATPPSVLWRHPCGDGYSGIAVAGNIAVTIEQRTDKETVVCYDRATGRQRWSYPYDALYQHVMGDGPRATPTIHKNRIYTLGATGELVCLSVEGKKYWSVNILDDNKAKNVIWGLSGSPLIVDDLVVVNPGIDAENPAGASLVAYEQKTGKKRWAAGNHRAGYSSPQLATLAGKLQIVLFDGEGVAGYDPAVGKELWQFPWITRSDMDSIQPAIVGGNCVFISSEPENGCALLRVFAPHGHMHGWNVGMAWTNKSLNCRFANPVTDGKYLYGLSNIAGILTCLDAKDGTLKWRGDRCGPGQLLLADGKLLVVNGKGGVMLVAADPAQYKELARFTVFDDKTWNTPSLAGDQLFMRNQSEIACLKLPRK